MMIDRIRLGIYSCMGALEIVVVTFPLTTPQSHHGNKQKQLEKKTNSLLLTMAFSFEDIDIN